MLPLWLYGTPSCNTAGRLEGLSAAELLHKIHGGMGAELERLVEASGACGVALWHGRLCGTEHVDAEGSPADALTDPRVLQLSPVASLCSICYV